MHTGLMSHQQRDLGLKSHPRDREVGNRSCDPWIGSLACYPLHLKRKGQNDIKNFAISRSC